MVHLRGAEAHAPCATWKGYHHARPSTLLSYQLMKGNKNSEMSSNAHLLI